MNAPAITLSAGQDTREDAAKIAHALWAEAVERGWEDEYREIIARANVGATVPVVGHILATLQVIGNADSVGTVGAQVKPLMVEHGAATVSFAHVAELEGESGSFDCICPDNAAFKARDLAVERFPELKYVVQVGHDKVDEAQTKCSSPDCRN